MFAGLFVGHHTFRVFRRDLEVKKPLIQLRRGLFFNLSLVPTLEASRPSWWLSPCCLFVRGLWSVSPCKTLPGWSHHYEDAKLGLFWACPSQKSKRLLHPWWIHKFPPFKRHSLLFLDLVWSFPHFSKAWRFFMESWCAGSFFENFGWLPRWFWTIRLFFFLVLWPVWVSNLPWSHELCWCCDLLLGYCNPFRFHRLCGYRWRLRYR